MDESLQPLRLAELALRVAREAGALAARGYRQRPEVQLKGRTDLVTEYDHASERLVRQRLAELRPDGAVLGEEQGGQQQAGLVWCVDPIDGTTNFVHGHPFWCVSLGALVDGAPVAGAVVAPALGLEWLGAVGEGAWRNAERCEVSATEQLERALVATGFPQARDRAPDNNFDAFVRVKQRVQGVRRCGSAALDLCLVADGTYDAYWERALQLWDVAAGAALVLAAGGRLTSLSGGAPALERGHLVASNGRLHEPLVSLVQDAAPSG